MLNSIHFEPLYRATYMLVPLSILAPKRAKRVINVFFGKENILPCMVQFAIQISKMFSAI